MKTLNIDIETFSDIDIKTGGLYKYVQSPDFQILLFAYSIDGAPVEIIDLAQGEKLPALLFNFLFDESIEKRAYNAPFAPSCIAFCIAISIACLVAMSDFGNNIVVEYFDLPEFGSTLGVIKFTYENLTLLVTTLLIVLSSYKFINCTFFFKCRSFIIFINKCRFALTFSYKL